MVLYRVYLTSIWVPIAIDKLDSCVCQIYTVLGGVKRERGRVFYPDLWFETRVCIVALLIHLGHGYLIPNACSSGPNGSAERDSSSTISFTYHRLLISFSDQPLSKR